MNRFDTYNESYPSDISAAVGKTVTRVSTDSEDDDILLELFLDDGTSVKFYHIQDCCESVSLDDVEGDWSDIVGSPLVTAEEVSDVPKEPQSPYDESYTWTFYKLATVNGYVTVKFYGDSNGYYSESVDVLIS